jgi:hypothetical protein
MVVAWRASPAQSGATTRDLVDVRRISGTGRLGPVRTLSTQESGDPSYLHVAVDAHGDALVAWQSLDEASNQNPQVWARRIAWGGARGPLVRVSAPDEAGGFPAVALAPKGGGAIMYQRDRNDWTLFRFSRASRVRHPVQLGEAIPYGARVVATRTGDFVTATRDRDGDLRGYRLRPDNTVLRRNISKATSSYGDLSGLGVDRNGTAWVTYEGSARPTGGKAAEFVRAWFRGGRLGRARRITPLRHLCSSPPAPRVGGAARWSPGRARWKPARGTSTGTPGCCGATVPWGRCAGSGRCRRSTRSPCRTPTCRARFPGSTTAGTASWHGAASRTGGTGSRGRGG